jgi:hypothetical protein
MIVEIFRNLFFIFLNILQNLILLENIPCPLLDLRYKFSVWVSRVCKEKKIGTILMKMDPMARYFMIKEGIESLEKKEQALSTSRPMDARTDRGR